MDIKEALEKATAVAGIIVEKYSICDVQNPTEDERTIYRVDCGMIFTLVKVLEDYLSELDNLLDREVPK
jgi:hypothetical protein